jgi:hypothetical protein
MNDERDDMPDDEEGELSAEEFEQILNGMSPKQLREAALDLLDAEDPRLRQTARRLLNVADMKQQLAEGQSELRLLKAQFLELKELKEEQRRRHESGEPPEPEPDWDGPELDED